jgi:hypothetical protein
LRSSANESGRATATGPAIEGLNPSNIVNGSSTRLPTPCGPVPSCETGWAAFTPIQNCLITQPEAEVLFSL